MFEPPHMELIGLWSINLNGNKNGAVETCAKKKIHRFDCYLNFSNPLIAKRIKVLWNIRICEVEITIKTMESFYLSLDNTIYVSHQINRPNTSKILLHNYIIQQKNFL
jgi:hypothetical protein